MKAATGKIGNTFCTPIFQSTPPVKAATYLDENGNEIEKISIHAAREGGDFDQAALMTGIDDFNPRRP